MVRKPTQQPNKKIGFSVVRRVKIKSIATEVICLQCSAGGDLHKLGATELLFKGGDLYKHGIQ